LLNFRSIVVVVSSLRRRSPFTVRAVTDSRRSTHARARWTHDRRLVVRRRPSVSRTTRMNRSKALSMKSHDSSNDTHTRGHTHTRGYTHTDSISGIYTHTRYKNNYSTNTGTYTRVLSFCLSVSLARTGAVSDGVRDAPRVDRSFGRDSSSRVHRRPPSRWWTRDDDARGGRA